MKLWTPNARIATRRAQWRQSSHTRLPPKLQAVRSNAMDCVTGGWSGVDERRLYLSSRARSVQAKRMVLVASPSERQVIVPPWPARSSPCLFRRLTSSCRTSSRVWRLLDDNYPGRWATTMLAGESDTCSLVLREPAIRC